MWISRFNRSRSFDGIIAAGALLVSTAQGGATSW